MEILDEQIRTDNFVQYNTKIITTVISQPTQNNDTSMVSSITEAQTHNVNTTNNTNSINTTLAWFHIIRIQCIIISYNFNGTTIHMDWIRKTQLRQL